MSHPLQTSPRFQESYERRRGLLLRTDGSFPRYLSFLPRIASRLCQVRAMPQRASAGFSRPAAQPIPAERAVPRLNPSLPNTASTKSRRARLTFSGLDSPDLTLARTAPHSLPRLTPPRRTSPHPTKPYLPCLAASLHTGLNQTSPAVPWPVRADLIQVNPCLPLRLVPLSCKAIPCQRSMVPPVAFRYQAE